MLNKQRVLDLTREQQEKDSSSIENTLAYIQNCLELSAITGETSLAVCHGWANYMSYDIDSDDIDAYFYVKREHFKQVQEELTESGFDISFADADGFIVSWEAETEEA